MENITYNLIKTALVNDTKFIDVVMLNGKLLTQLLEKKAEPNEFHVIHTLEGDSIEDMMKYANN